MTKAQVQKIAKANGLDISLVSIRKCSGTLRFEMADLPAALVKKNIDHYYETGDQLPEVEKLIKKYNKQAKKAPAAPGSEILGPENRHRRLGLRTGRNELQHPAGPGQHRLKTTGPGNGPTYRKDMTP